MSQNSSITVDQSQRRNDNDQRQIRSGRGNQMIPLANPSPPIARRILMIQNPNDIVSVLSEMSSSCRQAIYILKGSGHVRKGTLKTVQGSQQLNSGIGVGEIRYMSGWFQPPEMQNAGLNVAPFSRANGILHVSLSGNPHGVAIANTLIAFRSVEVSVVFVCGSESVVQPDAPGGLAAPIQVIIPYPPPQVL